jgi:hypothetical protein
MDERTVESKQAGELTKSNFPESFEGYSREVVF